MPPRRAATRTAVIRTEDEDEDVPTRRKRVSRAVAASDAEEAASGVASEASDDSDHKPVKKPAKRAPAKAPAKRTTSTSKATTTSTKARKAAKALADEDDDEEDTQNGLEEMVLPKPPSRGKAKGKATQNAKAPKIAASQKSSRAPSVVDSDLDEPLEATPLPRTPRPTQKRPEPVALDEEENIVLETPTRRPPVILSPVKPEPEEDKGPKPRLVIHKIVLVNFKSYAGRQEIGPFHKVRGLESCSVVLDTLIVFLCHRRSQRFRKIEHHRRPLVCLWISRL
jgi:structural maintenance of chromosome 4